MHTHTHTNNTAHICNMQCVYNGTLKCQSMRCQAVASPQWNGVTCAPSTTHSHKQTHILFHFVLHAHSDKNDLHIACSMHTPAHIHTYIYTGILMYVHSRLSSFVMWIIYLFSVSRQRCGNTSCIALPYVRW